MKVRLKPGLRHRADVFGGVCYVPHRDDFFAVDKRVYHVLKSTPTDWQMVNGPAEPAYVVLAGLGIVETSDPNTPEIACSRPSFIGRFLEVPTVSKPLVINCFATAFCPLACVYCHAHDLMVPFRDGETDVDLDNVAATAVMIPALVAVITGGDPLTRPDRARRLIERLAPHKALVLDTSGVGDIKELIPSLRAHRVHVRVSMDALSDINAKLRPGNTKMGFHLGASRHGAEQTIHECLAAGVPVTVQTVVSAWNESFDEWRNLRDWLIGVGVRHWVLHVVVKGGSARKHERAIRHQRRPRTIMPSPSVYQQLWRLVEQTITNDLPIDIRCTDTATSPNSVLLIGSNGDLYTEGLAHDGKVLLYRSGSARPDQIKELWPHVDHFGHARRYLNWNPWFFEGRSLETICVDFPEVATEHSTEATPVETEAKYRVADSDLLAELLVALAYDAGPPVLQRDEYFDTGSGLCSALDYVVRLREDGADFVAALKGPRSWSDDEYARVEIEFPAGPREAVRAALSKRGFGVTWVFEKRRATYRHKARQGVVLVDEIPELGYFVELEGDLEEVRLLKTQLSRALGPQERLNYKELFVAFKERAGFQAEDVLGAEFDS